jgi:DNA mismatch endonuclease (patch repair protein)
MANVARDEAVLGILLGEGWRVATVWECALRRPNLVNATADHLSAWLRSNELQLQIGDDVASSDIRTNIRSVSET